jgi:hypothetical protein
MEDLKQKEIIKKVLKVLDELNFKYEKNQEFLDFMKVTYSENEVMYDGETRNIYSVPFFMEFDPDFGETQQFSAYMEASTMEVISIGIAHGSLEIIYDENGKAKKTKFISPSIPYNKQ